jgi:hypothetical protein
MMRARWRPTAHAWVRRSAPSRCGSSRCMAARWRTPIARPECPRPMRPWRACAGGRVRSWSPTACQCFSATTTPPWSPPPTLAGAALAAGVLERTVERMGVTPGRVRAWLGPAIGPTAFEVGDEVRAAFVGADPGATAAFVAGGVPREVAGGSLRARASTAHACGRGADRRRQRVCTVADPAHFYSYRRDGTTGRFAALIWLEEGRPGAIA